MSRVELSEVQDMGRMGAVGSFGLTALTWVGVAMAQDSLPPVTAPALPPPAVEASPPAELPPVLQASPLQSRGSVLAVPGFPLPGSGPGPRPGRALIQPAAPPPAELPPLVGPAEAMGAGPGWSAMPGTSPSGPTLEPYQPQPGAIPSTDPLLRPAPAGPRQDPPGRTTTPINPEPHRSRLFGRFQPAPIFRGRGPSQPPDGITVEPRSDPAIDAAVKRKLEQQIRTAVGPHLRSAEVRVVGRDVTIHARVNRFWYRRNVKHTLETLPGLSGYRSHIEVTD